VGVGTEERSCLIERSDNTFKIDAVPMVVVSACYRQQRSERWYLLVGTGTVRGSEHPVIKEIERVNTDFG
jgi:uncharacterized NAD-dependent epimerase/dehydratase family protein